jgi:hypothetical protein
MPIGNIGLTHHLWCTEKHDIISINTSERSGIKTNTENTYHANYNKHTIIYRIAWFFKNLIENEYIARKLQQTSYNNL